MAEKSIGKVIHYYDKAMVAVVRLTGSVSLGDAIRILKGDQELEMQVESMQIDHEPVEKGKAGDEIAIKVGKPVKDGAEVLKIS